MSEDRRIRISEIFGPTIQGEGALIGQPTIFVRTGGCDFRCRWCDSLHAVDSRYRHDWTPMTAIEIMDRVRALSGGKPIPISLSGGNPALQPLGELIAIGKRDGFRFFLETQASVAQDWFSELDMLVLSPKPPSSGMQTDWSAVSACIEAADNAPIVLKFIVFDDTDFNFAREGAARFRDMPVYLQPGNHTPPPASGVETGFDLDGIMDRMRWLIDRVNSDKWYEARVLPQLHTLVWGNMRGV
jgi:7-carboxy-7-deazaguanine synthase